MTVSEEDEIFIWKMCKFQFLLLRSILDQYSKIHEYNAPESVQ